MVWEDSFFILPPQFHSFVFVWMEKHPADVDKGIVDAYIGAEGI